MRSHARGIILACTLVAALSLAGVLLGAARRAVRPASELKPATGWLAFDSAQAAAQPGSDIQVVRAYFDDPALVARAAAFLEPWRVDYAAGYMLVEADQDIKIRLESLGFRLEVDEKLTRQLNQPLLRLPQQTSGIPGYPCYRTVEETYATAQALAENYPHLAAWVDIGDTWEKATPGDLPGYDLMVLRLTNDQVPGPKPKLFVMSSVHAREFTPAELTTRFAEYLVQEYDHDPDITWLLDYSEIHLLLQANPDGRKHAETGQPWRKNTDNNYCTDTDTRGADLNRNFSFAWGCCGGSSGNQCSVVYRGPAPASEPETQAVEAYLRAQYPDLRADDLLDPAPANAQGVFIDIHSFSELVLWPWGFTETEAPNGPAMQTMGRKLAYFNDYLPVQAIDLYPTDGTTDDFAYGDLGIASFAFELGTSFFESCTVFEEQILPANLPALLYAAKVARAPYLLPAGPDVVDLAAAPLAVAPGDLVQISARVDDRRYSTASGEEPVQAIAAAAFTIDTPPWITATVISHPLQAIDGAFDTASEWVSASLDTTGLALGRHTLYLHGQDAAGNWGPVSALHIYLLDLVTAPRLQGSVRESATGLPLEATVTAGDFQAQTDPTSGAYEMLLVSGTYTITASAPGYGISQTVGVPLQDGQVTQLDFQLYPLCTLFEDDVESGAGDWQAELPWGITALAAHSPSHSWTDSPGGDYADMIDIYLTSPPVNLVGVDDVQLKFWQQVDIELPGADLYDYGAVEYSADGGAIWHQAANYFGYAQPWEEIALPLPALAGSAQAQVRFHLHSDEGVVADGWYLDDIRLEASGPACLPQRSPVAGFTSNSPVGLGAAIEFTNLTTGTPPISYSWEFGDGSAISTATHPAHTYAETGTYTVTLEATNALGSDQAQAVVSVGETVHVADLQLSLAGPAPYYAGEPQSFLLSLSPLNVTVPYSYSLDFGDSSPLLSGQTAANPLALGHTYISTGTYTLAAQAWNLGMGTPVSATLAVYLADPRGAIVRLPLIPDLFVPASSLPPVGPPPSPDSELQRP